MSERSPIGVVVGTSKLNAFECQQCNALLYLTSTGKHHCPAHAASWTLKFGISMNSEVCKRKRFEVN